MRTRSFAPLLPLCVFLSAAFAAPARADDSLKGTVGGEDPASKGNNDITSDGFTAIHVDEKPEDKKDATDLSISAGGLESAGNARLLALTTLESFRIRRSDNQFSALFAGNYSRTALPGQDATTTVENLQGKARYDRFLDAHWTLFFGAQARRDRFQGLNLRLQLDPGVGYYFVNEEKFLVWAEAGYDYLHDIRRDDALVDPTTGAPLLDADGNPLGKTKTVHSGRLFLGYLNKISDGTSINFGIEYLAALTDTTFWKINADVGVTAKLSKSFALATTLQVRYDHAPLPGKEKLDTTTAVSLVYTLL